MAEFCILANRRGFEGFDEAHEGAWKGPFSFVQAADTQLGMIEMVARKNGISTGTGAPVWDDEIRLFRQLIAGVNRMQPRPRFLVVCGDLIDAMPGVSYRAAQIADFKKVFAELHPEIRAVCVCGNHDVGDVPTPATIGDYRATFGDDYFAFWVGGCKFIVINSQLYLDCSKTPDEQKAQIEWLDRELNGARKPKHLIGFQHVAPFVHDAYENAVSYGPAKFSTFNFGDKSARQEFLEKLTTAKMSKLFCGHYHRNAGGWFGDLEVVVTSAVGCQLGTDKSGARIVRVLDDGVEHAYVELEHF